MTKRNASFVVGAAVMIVAAGAFAYPYRLQLRHAWEDAQKATLPAATKYVPQSAQTSAGGEQVSPVEGGVATSQHYIVVTSPTTASSKTDPFVEKGPLPASVNLDVPFTSQAPKGNWDQPFQDACEEASIIMVDAFYRGISGVLPPDQATRAITELVAFENKRFGDYKDTDADENAIIAKEYFGYSQVLIVPFNTEKMKRALANGFPVILPADGKALQNPNFRNGGPPFHMFVVKGYTGNKFITNDPGTSRGANYTYTATTLQNAAHDWNDGNVKEGEPLMIVILPRQR